MHPLICLGINVLVQILSLRYLLVTKLLKSVFLGFIIGLLSMFILAFYLTGIAIANLITYLALSYCYFHFINLGETARRIRILRELYDCPDGLSVDELLARYNAQEIIEKRIKRLLNNGQIIYRDKRYYIGNPIMLFMAKVLIALKLALLGKRSEFENIQFTT